MRVRVGPRRAPIPACEPAFEPDQNTTMKPSSSPADWTPDSPELTTFALKDGPFDPAVPGWAERRADVEQVVAGSPALRAEIGEIRRLADNIEVDLAREPVHRLSSDRRQSVLAYARNPGRGLPRRSSDEASASGGSAWHRFWSGLTRPTMGFGLAAATALSIALALWNPWRRPAPDASAPMQVAKAAVSNAPAKPKRPGRKAESEAAPREVVITGSFDSEPDVRSPKDPRPADRSVPSEEVERGESRLRWESTGVMLAGASGSAGSASPRSATVGGREAVSRQAPAANASAKSIGATVGTPGSTAVPLPPVSTQTPRSVAGAAAKARSAPAADPLAPDARPTAPRRQARTTREIPFQSAAAEPRSSFPLKPGDASYPEVRRELERGRWPSPDAVRLEELLNHFSYDYPTPSGSDPLSAHVEVADSPWSPDHRLVKIGLQARSAPPETRPPANLVVLVGLRPGSSARLSWAQRSLQALVETLDGRDSLALLLDGPRGGVVLPPTSGAERDTLSRGVAALRADGAPGGLDGLRRAYALAARRRGSEGVHRVIWVLDGEFSAEAGTREALAKLIGEQTEQGVVLTVLGLGTPPVSEPSRESWMPTPSGGVYASADGPAQTREALQREVNPMPTAAEDVKVDVRFNPARVDRWRLLGQEAPGTAPRSGNPDDPSGVRIESGEAVTALYEIVPTRPAGAPGAVPEEGAASAAGVRPDELLRLQVGYRTPPNGNGREASPTAVPSRSLELVVPDAARGIDAATADYKFAAAVVGYGLLLRDSPFKGDLTWDKVLALAEEGQGPDREGYRAEFLGLVRRARDLHESVSRVPDSGPAPVTPRP